MPVRAALAGLLAAAMLVMLPKPVSAWSINTHMYVANRVLEDLADGAITIHEVVLAEDGSKHAVEPPLGQIAVPGDVVSAILSHPEVFRAGNCGPDGFPDMYIGQSIIHPYEPGQHWRAIDWVQHLLEQARDAGGETRAEALAFAYGFAAHCAGDALGHTWVNSHSGGVWDWGDMGVVKRHVALESYVNSRIPAADQTAECFALQIDREFVADALVRHDAVAPSRVRASHLQALMDYREAFRKAERTCENLLDNTWGVDVSCGAISSLEEAFETQRERADDAIEAWISTSAQIMRDVATGSYYEVPGRVSDWMAEWIPRLLAVPEVVLQGLDYLCAPIDALTAPIEERFMALLSDVYDSLLRETFEEMVNPDVFLAATFDASAIEAINDDMGITAEHPDLDLDAFDALYDSIVLAKLSLLDGEGIAQLGALLGVEIPTSGGDDHILYHCINSLDASYQLSLYPPISSARDGRTS